MGQPIIQSFITTADDSGAKKISSALKDVSSDMKAAGEASKPLGDNIDNISGKLGYMGERKLGNIVFKDLAFNAVGAASSMNAATSAAEALTGGLEIGGRIALAYSGEIGLAILAVGALVTLFIKLEEASNKSAETLKKETTEWANWIVATEKSRDFFVKINNLRKDEVLYIDKSIEEKKKKIVLDQIEVETQLKWLENEQRKTLANSKYSEETRGEKQSRANLDLQTMINAQLEKKLALSQSLQILETAETDKKVKAINLEALSAKQSEERYTANLSLIQVLERKQAREQIILELEKKLNSTEDENAKKILQAQIEANKQLEESDAKRAEQFIANGKKMEQEEQKLANEIVKGANAIASGWENQNGRLVFSTAKASAAIIGIVAQQIEAQLAMAAAKDFAEGNIGMAVAEAAGVGIVANLAGAASAALGGSGTTSSSVGVGSATNGSTASSSSSASGSGNTLTNLTVELRGGYFDESAADKLAQMLSKRVQQGNIRLVSSTVLSNVGQVPG